MNSAKVLPTRLLGTLFYIEDNTFDDKKKFQKELLVIKEEDYYSDSLHGSIHLNTPYKNRKLIFDIKPDPDYWASSFIGFIYPGGKMLGTIKYIKEANTAEGKFVGKHIVTKSKRIIAFGYIHNSNKTRDCVCIELKPIK